MIRLGPNYIKLDTIYRNIGELVPKPDIEVEVNVPYVLIFFGILLIFNFLSRRRVQIIDFWIDLETPRENTHAREILQLFSFHINYIAHFRIRQNPVLLILSMNMPRDLDLLKTLIDNMYVGFLENDHAVDMSYRTLEGALHRRAFNNHIESGWFTSRHELLFEIYRNTYEEKIFILRKLESLYLYYVPTYVRKPRIPSERT